MTFVCSHDNWEKLYLQCHIDQRCRLALCCWNKPPSLRGNCRASWLVFLQFHRGRMDTCWAKICVWLIRNPLGQLSEKYHTCLFRQHRSSQSVCSPRLSVFPYMWFISVYCMLLFKALWHLSPCSWSRLAVMVADFNTNAVAVVLLFLLLHYNTYSQALDLI